MPSESRDALPDQSARHSCIALTAGGYCSRRNGHAGQHATLGGLYLDEIDRLRAENEALKAENSRLGEIGEYHADEIARLRSLLAGDESAIYPDCGACLGAGKTTHRPCEWCAENRRINAARSSDENDQTPEEGTHG
jgi:hypothetical protein